MKTASGLPVSLPSTARSQWKHFCIVRKGRIYLWLVDFQWTISRDRSLGQLLIEGTRRPIEIHQLNGEHSHTTAYVRVRG